MFFIRLIIKKVKHILYSSALKYLNFDRYKSIETLYVWCLVLSIVSLLSFLYDLERFESKAL